MSAAASSPYSSNSNSDTTNNNMRLLSEIEDYDDNDDADVDTDDDDDDDDDGAPTFTPVTSSPAKQRSRRLYGQDILARSNSDNNKKKNSSNHSTMTSGGNSKGNDGDNNNNYLDANNSIPPPPPPLPPGRFSTMSSLAYSTTSTSGCGGGGGGLNDSMLFSSLWDGSAIGAGGGSWYFHPTPTPPTSMVANNTSHSSGNTTDGDDDDEGGASVPRGVVTSNYPIMPPYHNPGSLPGAGYGMMGGGGNANVLPPYLAYWLPHYQLHQQPQQLHQPQQLQQQEQQRTNSGTETDAAINNFVNYQLWLLQQQQQQQHQPNPYHNPQQQQHSPLDEQQPHFSPPYHYPQLQVEHHHSPQYPDLTHLLPPSNDDAFKVYSTRWIMLLYMSLLNLLSDWTCYSVAPIALLTMNAFGDVDAESLVTVFLAANAIASALEPAILGRLGLRRTILFGGFLLTLGSIVKSGGLQSTLLMGASSSYSSSSSNGGSSSDSGSSGNGETWRLYLGFFLVGLSQPLYQCTPALLSASWFPENERTMATGVALNSNQLGIGCAFVFGTMLVSTEDDILPYFGLLSLISTLTFVGCALQFEDAPPTPPSDTARVIRGDLEIKIPKHWPIIGRFGRGSTVKRGSTIVMEESVGDGKNAIKFAKDAGISSSVAHANSARAEISAIDAIREWEAQVQDNTPSRSSTEESAEEAMAAISKWKAKTQSQLFNAVAHAPSPASTDEPIGTNETPSSSSQKNQHIVEGIPFQTPPLHHASPHPLMALPDHPFATPPPFYPNPYMMMSPPPSDSHYHHLPFAHPGPTIAPSFYHGYDEEGHYHNALLESMLGYDDYRTRSLVGIETDDEGVEPIMTQVDRQLDIDIRDDQLIQQFKACFRRKGFSHCVVAFTTSGIIINTLSTYMDYLVTLNGAGREYVGIVGGTFQILIMVSSLVFGGWTDASRKYYFVTLAMLIFGAFALAVCNVDLDSNAGGDLRWNLLTVAVLAGPLQPISTELGVEVVYPLSENTVLVIQQLFSNLLSAAFIPVFKALRDVKRTPDVSEIENVPSHIPQYTFSFYMLIIISAVATCYFATFNGTYLRYEAEEAKKAEKESERERLLSELHMQHGYGSTPVQ